ncbi:MAG: redoxin domain-containing protein [Desulfobacterales bacterium]|nr:redoxin domain-containing protein [Desulfobacterales bacterium]
MKLQEKLDQYKKSFLEKAPPDAVAVMQQATRDLADSGLVEKAVKAGDCAPDFTLKNTEGDTVSLSGLLLKGPVVLTFYRGKW